MIVGLLLAAGESRRFGSNKLLHPLNGGEALVIACAKKLRPHVDQLLVVCKHSDHTVHQLLTEQRFPYAICPNADEGMGASLAFGINKTSNADAWLIALADMPFIASADYQKCVAALCDSHSITAPQWQERRGHPVGFASRWHNELIAIKGDQGARSLLQQHTSQVFYFQATNNGVLRDIDTPEDAQL